MLRTRRGCCSYLLSKSRLMRASDLRAHLPLPPSFAASQHSRTRRLIAMLFLPKMWEGTLETCPPTAV